MFYHFSPEALLTQRRGRKQNDEFKMRVYISKIFFSHIMQKEEMALFYSAPLYFFFEIETHTIILDMFLTRLEQLRIATQKKKLNVARKIGKGSIFL